MRDQAETKFPPPTGSLCLRHSTLDKQCFSRVVKLFTMMQGRLPINFPKFLGDGAIPAGTPRSSKAGAGGGSES